MPYIMTSGFLSHGLETERWNLCIRRSSIYAYATDYRRFDTYFKCNFPDNVTGKCDYVEAIADGAMVFVTNKVDDPKKLICWNKQRACFLFEVFHLMLWSLIGRLKSWMSPLDNWLTWVANLLLKLRQAKGLHKFSPKCWVSYVIVVLLKSVSKW